MKMNCAFNFRWLEIVDRGRNEAQIQVGEKLNWEASR